MAEQAGFEALWISDHFHPWLDEQGNSSFVWSVIGAISQVTTLPITTAVTCPTTRIHPAIIAQAAATAGLLTGGRFNLGVGTGEALNEHVTGEPWPAAEVRREMLEEAVGIIAELFAGGQVTHHGKHYTVETARLYSRPAQPPPIYVSGFGEQSAELAAQIGDGYICIGPEADLVKRFRDSGGGPSRSRAASRAAGRRTPPRRARPCGGCGRATSSPASRRSCCRRRGTSASWRRSSPMTWSRRPPARTRSRTWRRSARSSRPASTRSTCSRSAATWKAPSSSSPPRCCHEREATDRSSSFLAQPPTTRAGSPPG